MTTISTLDDDALTRDQFLGGRINVWQQVGGYRAGLDPVLLAASVRAAAGQSVLELGCGVGVASLCLWSRIPGVDVVGVELQDEYAVLAARNAAENQARLAIIQADLRQLPAALRARTFDHVMMNPPYYERTKGTSATDTGRDIAMGGETPLTDWIDTATRRLRPGGSLTLIQSIIRLPDVLNATDHRLGSITILPLAGRSGRPAGRFLLRARKGGKGVFRLLPTCHMHAGARHVQGKEDYTPAIASVLRTGAALDWGD